MTTLSTQLDALADLQASLTALQLEKQAAIDATIPPDVKAELESIELEFSTAAAIAEAKINALTEQIKNAVLENGATVKGTFLQAVYTKGRVTWDGKQLDGMMALIPGLAAARKEGAPSVSFRQLK